MSEVVSDKNGPVSKTPVFSKPRPQAYAIRPMRTFPRAHHPNTTFDIIVSDEPVSVDNDSSSLRVGCREDTDHHADC